MQEKFAIRAATTTTSSNIQTEQIDKSILKYDEMLYIPKSIEYQRSAKKRYVQCVNSIGVACETACNLNGSKYVRRRPYRRRHRRRWSNDGDDKLVVLKYTKFSQSGFTNVFITLIVLCLWPWSFGGSNGSGNSGTVGFVHCDRSVNVFENGNFSSTTIEPINWLLAPSATTATPSPPTQTMTISKKSNAKITQSTSTLLPISNVFNTNDKSSKHNNHEMIDSNDSITSNDRRNHQHQQRISIIKTRSKKTNPNASFNLDLFKQQQQQQQERNTTSGRVQNMQSNHTLNRLDEHESNRIPDVMNVRESLYHHYQHHHHSVIKRFRAFVTKRYHFSAKKTKDKSNIGRFQVPSNRKTNSMTNIMRRPAPLQHLIYVLSSIENDNDNDNGDHQSLKSANRENAQGIHEIARRHTTATADPHLNTGTILTLINQTKILLRDLHEKHFDLRGNKHIATNAISSQNPFVTIPSKSKRSIDLQLKQQNQKQQPNSKPTVTQPFDDHFFNSKLKNYYFLYQIDNISNYNNHFDLLNSPSNYNATTTQVQTNKQHIQLSNHRQQIDNALIATDATERDFLKYNPQSQSQQKQPLNFSNLHSNHIKRILLAKIASVCLNCVNSTTSSITTIDPHVGDNGNGIDENDMPVKIYVLPRSLRSVTATESGHRKLIPFINDGRFERTTNNANNDDMEWNETMLQQSLKNYPRIAGLLGNLSLTEIPNQFNYRQNQNRHSNDADISQNFIIDSTESNGGSNNISHATIATTAIRTSTTLPSTLYTPHNNFNFNSISLSKSSLKTSNNVTTTTTANPNNNDVVKKATTPIRANNVAMHISTNNYSPISTFEHYIRIISSRKNYYAIQTNGNKSKSLNFQQQQQQQPHSMQPKFQRVKKQKQIIKLFATNHRFILNNDKLIDNNNIHDTDENDSEKNVNAITNTITNTTAAAAIVGDVIDDHTNGYYSDGYPINIVKNYKLNFTLNENNCNTKVLNFDQVNPKNVKNQSQQQSNCTIATKAIKNYDNDDNMKHKKTMKDHIDPIKLLTTSNKQRLTVEKQLNVNRIMAESMIKISNGKINRKLKKNHHGSDDKPSRSSTNAINSYLMRLESIKYQILMKLGLKQKPNITTTLPKHVIMETLYRADDNNVPQSNDNPGRREHHRKQHGQKSRNKQKQKQKHPSKLSKTTKHKLTPPILLNEDPNQQVYQFERPHFSSAYNSNDDKNGNHNRSNSDDDKFPFGADIFAEETNDIESDDFYGRTREIIIFAEKGSYFNHQPLIEFVSTNGLDESDNSNSASSDPISETVQLNHTSSLSSLSLSSSSSSSSLHRLNNTGDTKLKQRTKCKGDIIANRQIRKRKRRRRQVDTQSMDAKQIEQTQTKPVILVSNEKQVLKKMAVKSSMEQTQYQQSNSDFNSDTRVRRAFLWIKVDEMASNTKKNSSKNHKSKGKHRHRSTIHRNFFRLWVFRIVEPTSEPNQQIKLSASKSVHVSRLGWQKLDVTSTVRQWYAYGGKTRLRFLVDCSGCVDRIKIHLFDGKPVANSKAKVKPNLLQNDKLNTSSDPVRPFLVIYTDPHVIKRVRRHTPDCSVAVRGQCCKQKFYVSFAELGWEDWIIAPHGYYANYCQGNCNGMRTPDNFRSYHSHVIEEYRKMNRLTGLQPCCTPLKFSSMSLIYYEENQKIIKRDLPKMVVDECGCP